MSRRPKRKQNQAKRHVREKRCGEDEEHRLNLEPETAATRQLKTRNRARIGFRVAVGVTVIAGLVALGRATVSEALVKNPRFSLRQVIVNTEGSLTPQKIVRTTGLTEGQNLLTTNLREVRERIEQLPEVKSATVSRDYDGRLMVEVIQRHPVAWIECHKLRIFHMKSGSGCLLDSDGVAIPCEVLVRDYLRLPVIRIEDLGQVTPGAPVQSPQVAAALRLLEEFDRLFDDDQDEIETIEIPNRYALQAKFRNGMEVTFGCDDLDVQLARYQRIKSKAREQQWQIATLNLLAQQNIPVTFRAAPQSQAPAPRARSGQRN